ncbi:MAG: hypothetical protein AAGE01_02900 [Pseudomonadota bacterium]
MRILLLLLTLLVAAIPVNAQPIFELPTPEGFATETIPFPLAFAPSLDYEGVEEIRFSPGFFDAEANDFWTYAFLWWVESAEGVDESRLATELEAYFRGLAQAVATANEFDPGPLSVRGNFAGAGQRRFDGTVESYDAFVTRAPITLNVEVTVERCGAEGHDAVVFLLSPRPATDAAWEPLRRIREGFRCARL